MRSGPAPKGPRLWLERARVRADGSLAPARWCIRDDGGFKRRTDFGAEERGRAESDLKDYIAAKHKVPSGTLEPGQRLISDILKLYADDVAIGHSRPGESADRIARLLSWWAQPARAMRDMRKRGMTAPKMTGHLTDIEAMTCRGYVAFVGASRSASMDLELLRAAQNHAVEQRKLTYALPVTLPAPSAPRERWLTRSELAKAIWRAWRYRRTQGETEDGWGSRKHVARFILAAYYSGTRKTAVLLGAFERKPGFGYVDLENGIWYRKPQGRRTTKKRQTPVPIPAQLLGHMRRWRKNGQTFVIEYGGEPVARLDKAFRRMMREDLGFGPDVVIHTLRHTAITHALQNGMSPYDATAYFGISLEVLMETYGHHCPTHLREAASMMRPPRRDRNLVAATKS